MSRSKKEDDGEARRSRVDAFVRELFTNGVGQRAERLVLLSDECRSLGGWCERAVADRVEAFLIAETRR